MRDLPADRRHLVGVAASGAVSAPSRATCAARAPRVFKQDMFRCHHLSLEQQLAAGTTGAWHESEGHTRTHADTGGHCGLF